MESLSKPKQNYLTKSRFKIALECPTRLYYNDNKQYANQSMDDPFLMNLARGGFQVGALAKCYHPGGIEIETRDHHEAFSQTLELLQQENVIIFEAAFLFENCFIRADVLIKKGNEIELIEVKAKSYSQTEDDFFQKKKGGIDSGWKPYLCDIAFQTWVTRQSLQSVDMAYLQVAPFLMLANKEANASVEGLNQRFYIDAGNKIILDKKLCTPENLGTEILIKVAVGTEVQFIHEHPIEEYELSFVDFINQCETAVKKNEIIWNKIGAKCKKCTFITDEADIKNGKLSGFQECWKNLAGFTDEDFKRPMSWEIWGAKSGKWLQEKKYFIDQLSLSDVEPKNPSQKICRGLSRMERQEEQRIKTINNDYTPYVDRKALREYFSEWQYPLHCIDFETSMMALPFHKGMHPYEQIAFQFSHHIIYEDGSVIHQDEWLNVEAGHFPNFDFVRALKKALEMEGTIFRYATHENTVLCQVYEQLLRSEEPDKEELMDFIKGITKKKSKEVILWEGDRNMVDLLEVVKSCYYSLYAKGSNSIKYILPAVLNSSVYLQEKYSQPVYGTSKMISKNYKDFTWIEKENGSIKNPYKLLKPIFSEKEDLFLDELLMDEDAGIADGGAAMAAYSKMQFTQMSDTERERVSNALLRYCELDTLAMVMILEEFTQLVKRF